MNLSTKPISPLLRALAAATFLVWVAAQVLCTAHCSLGVGHDGAEAASCHGPAAAQSHHDDNDAPGPAGPDSSSTAACLTLKSALVSASVIAPVPPQFHLLYTLAPAALALDAMATEWAASFSRQARPRDWPFTPEVSLGPAHRSHAPPFLS
jgi:hypothetical protein